MPPRHLEDLGLADPAIPGVQVAALVPLAALHALGQGAQEALEVRVQPVAVLLLDVVVRLAALALLGRRRRVVVRVLGRAGRAAQLRPAAGGRGRGRDRRRRRHGQALGGVPLVGVLRLPLAGGRLALLVVLVVPRRRGQLWRARDYACRPLPVRIHVVVDVDMAADP